MSVVTEIKNSDNYLKYKKILKLCQSRLDLEVVKTEAMNLHASRTSRSLYGKSQYSIDALVGALMKDLAYRSRMVELRVIVSSESSILED
jgi:hypothetical protein